MSDLLLPLSIRKDHPFVFMRAKYAGSQVEADKIIREVIPEWQGDTMSTKAWERKREQQADLHDRQMAGTFSLELCQGGGNYHRASRSEIKRTYNPPLLNAVVQVPEDHAHPEIASPPRVPKSYLPQYDPKRKYKVEAPVLEPVNPLLDV